MLNVGFKTFDTPEYKYDTLGDTANVGVIQGIKTSARQAFSLNPSESIFNIFERNEAYNESKVVLKKEDLNKKVVFLINHYILVLVLLLLLQIQLTSQLLSFQ